jgi:hypothetical protein
LIDRKKFFAAIKPTALHSGHFKQEQVDGYTALLDAWEQGYDQYPRQYLAYCLATAFHETAATLQPIRERGTASYFEKYGVGKLARLLGNRSKDDGVLYAGRGYVQITGYRNYDVAGRYVGADLLGHPDLALDPHIAAQALFAGLTQGWFTGKRLADYRVGTSFDAINARRTVNGTDCALKIAGYYAVYIKALA